jgi:hypothetical protein
LVASWKEETGLSLLKSAAFHIKVQVPLIFLFFFISSGLHGPLVFGLLLLLLLRLLRTLVENIYVIFMRTQQQRQQK